MSQHIFLYFFFNDTATTEIYTLSLHDALPIFRCGGTCRVEPSREPWRVDIMFRMMLDQPQCMSAKAGQLLIPRHACGRADRKSTRLNSSHANISYAVFCLKKNKTHEYIPNT